MFRFLLPMDFRSDQRLRLLCIRWLLSDRVPAGCCAGYCILHSHPFPLRPPGRLQNHGLYYHVWPAHCNNWKNRAAASGSSCLSYQRLSGKAPAHLPGWNPHRPGTDRRLFAGQPLHYPLSQHLCRPAGNPGSRVSCVSHLRVSAKSADRLKHL